MNKNKPEILLNGRYIVSCGCGHIHDITDRISQAEDNMRKRCLEEYGKDTERLNFLDKLNKRLNDHFGTNYGWEMVINHNVTRLFSKDVNTVDLNDADSNGYKSCREAIDQATQNINNLDKE